jgi:hypothetical protein
VSGAYVIRILVAEGDPEGVRVVDKSNWIGQGVVFARSDLKVAASHGIDSPGVYILAGADPDGVFDSRVYIGQGEDVRKRLASHLKDDAKDFWTDTIVFVSSSGSLNRAHITYLESRLVDLAFEAKRVSVANGNRPTLPSLSAADRAEADGFLREMLDIYPLLGVDAFETLHAAPSDSIRYFLSGRDASGEGEDRADGFLVFAGATARVEETASFTSFRKVRAQLLSSGSLVRDAAVYRLSEDTLFKSPSAAAATLMSRNANGRAEWKDKDGVSLKDHQAAAAGVDE